MAGFKTNVGQSTLDAGVTYYYYPNSTFQFSDFFEVYTSLSHTLGPVTGKVGVTYAPKQQALSLDGISKEDSLYVSGDLSAGIPKTPISVNAHLGRSFERSYLTFGQINDFIPDDDIDPDKLDKLLMSIEELGLEVISDKQVAAELEISRTPVREALLTLQAEGLVVTRPQSGTFVGYDGRERFCVAN